MESTPTVLNKYDQLLLKFDPESMRGRAVRAIRDFRSSWIDLGRTLCDVAYGGDYKDWGYEDFEVYCARELGLKKPTAKKLMVSYQYMKGREPELLQSAESGETKSLPDYTTVEQLARAEKCADVDHEKIESVRVKVFSGELTDADAKREIKSARAEQTLPDMERVQAITDIRRMAKSVRKKMSMYEKFIPDGMYTRAENVLLDLEIID
ncbi:MAG: hypothetical protein WC905_02610 [Patescibacteria group bacterium]|jgi:hypothetical protein